MTVLFCGAAASCAPSNETTLACTIVEPYPTNATDQLINQDRHRIEARLLDKSQDGVWDFEGRIYLSKSGGNGEPIRGYYYEYGNGDFDLVASSSDMRITIMPSNSILQERGAQGVIMRNGQTVATGLVVSATCRARTREKN